MSWVFGWGVHHDHGNDQSQGQDQSEDQEHKQDQGTRSVIDCRRLKKKSQGLKKRSHLVSKVSTSLNIPSSSYTHNRKSFGGCIYTEEWDQVYLVTSAHCIVDDVQFDLLHLCLSGKTMQSPSCTSSSIKWNKCVKQTMTSSATQACYLVWSK